MATDVLQPSYQLMAGPASSRRVGEAVVRDRPDAHGRSAISRVVIETLEQVMPAGRSRRLSVHESLADVGIDTERFLDALSRLEGRYQMRFHASWLTGVCTCGDLIDCVAEHMFDAADRGAAQASATQQSPRRSITDPVAAGTDSAWPECDALEERLVGLEAAGLENPFLLANEAVNGRVATLNGHDTISFTSFDYLGLAGHPDVRQAAKDAIDRFGCSASASRMVGGNNTILDALDAELADFIGTERAVMFPCGYGTNASVFNHLFGAGDLILHDELAHNSIVQGAALSKAGKRSFRHNDHQQLDSLLGDLRSQYRRVVVAIEGVYSMDGDYPDLPRFLEVKRKHDAMLYVDEAHSIGTMGPEGRGICDFFGVDPREGDLWMGTISKALGAQGGYLAGPERLIRYLGFTTPAFVFSTACSPPSQYGTPDRWWSSPAASRRLSGSSAPGSTPTTASSIPCRPARPPRGPSPASMLSLAGRWGLTSSSAGPRGSTGATRPSSRRSCGSRSCSVARPASRGRFHSRRLPASCRHGPADGSTRPA